MKKYSGQFNNILSRILKRLKLGFNLSLLPTKVEIFHNNPFTRIFRVLGGISIILFLSSLSITILDNFYIHWSIFSLAMLHFSYIIIISFIKLWYLIYMWKNKKLEVRNSPLDNVASLALELAELQKQLSEVKQKTKNLTEFKKRIKRFLGRIHKINRKKY